ncbi:MAG: hypothetical protein M1839_001750 [Geoglossum umbratile]|nr:MAG: hypothetical protein M1839_001750 [Geoglossum umbratile]
MNTRPHATQQQGGDVSGIISRSSQEINSVGGWANDIPIVPGKHLTGNGRRSRNNRAGTAYSGPAGAASNRQATSGSRALENHQYSNHQSAVHGGSVAFRVSAPRPSSITANPSRPFVSSGTDKITSPPSKAGFTAMKNSPNRTNTPSYRYSLVRFKVSPPQREPWTSEHPRFRVSDSTTRPRMGP